ncbi:MAG: hypothetical protein R3316_12295 [Rhodovibrionaceae bacterium]|nr:hypothetical protein [Rhodovibrionaceae bacterium]
MSDEIVQRYLKSEWWVDETGAWRPWLNSPGAASGGIFPDTGIGAHFAFSRYGLLRVRRCGSQVAVRFDLRAAEDDGIESVRRFLDRECRDCEIDFGFYFDAWNFEHYSHGSDALTRLEEVRDFRQITLAERITAKQLEPERVMNCGSLLQWIGRRLSGPQKDIGLESIQDILDYLVLYQWDEESSQWVCLHAGRKCGCAWVYGQSWVRGAAGRPYRVDEPGRTYSKRVMHPYARVLETGEPWLGHIRAIMERPGQTPLWVPYERFLFRVFAPNGQPMLACLSNITQDIDIPFLKASA